ncbi:hypothetical protein BCR44DRAFT_1425259 [Catenaria anguillulae PL171]|uniref:Uncharacterized protein n=1 Tax=Catenaria anguillulae PL171 TaxID=765915 RepID=A0A1Y2I109_9FUNG|nr:hypothetical protein BCR44DRAFT_1425259 [Catenaria anguillulae PL171]
MDSRAEVAKERSAEVKRDVEEVAATLADMDLTVDRIAGAVKERAGEEKDGRRGGASGGAHLVRCG